MTSVKSFERWEIVLERDTTKHVVNLNKSLLDQLTGFPFMRWSRSHGFALGQAGISRCLLLNLQCARYKCVHIYIFTMCHIHYTHLHTLKHTSDEHIHARGAVFAVSTFLMNSLQGKRNCSSKFSLSFAFVALGDIFGRMCGCGMWMLYGFRFRHFLFISLRLGFLREIHTF